MKSNTKTEEELKRMRGMARCLMLLKAHGGDEFKNKSSSSRGNRVFECKTCMRQFASFQALGGHRASHKKPRLLIGGVGDETHNIKNFGLIMKSKSSSTRGHHECTICGQEFTIGQALGGHMRRHRNPNRSSSSEQGLHLLPAKNDCISHPPPLPPLIEEVGVVLEKKQADVVQTKRFLCWDLNLSPPPSDDQERQFDHSNQMNNLHENSMFSKSILASMLTF